MLLLANAAYSATFVVTSNADDGPGTLREALNSASANGPTDQDIIKFNLPGPLTSDRTIRLKTQLPYITANVVIDGTTQPGIAFGVSDSKVIIEPDASSANFSALVIAGDYTSANVTQGVEIYGLYIRNFAQINNLVTYNSAQGSGIYIQGNAGGLKIGAPGKGNVICGTINAIYNNNSYYNYNTSSSDITIQSNIIGLADDGKTPISNINGISIGYFNTITIGGTDANMGNTIAANVTNVGILSSYSYAVVAQTVSIKNNKIGTDYLGIIDYKQSPLFLASSFIKTYGINATTSNSSVNANVDISNNLISGQIGYGIFISYATYSIKNNKIGTDITGTHNLGNYEGIRSDAGARGTIGGSGATDKNYIGYNTYGIEVANSTQALITQNSIFCNSSLGINIASATYQVPYVQVLTFRSDMVAGLATPNCAIELFYSDDCGYVNCQGKEYITTVQSDGTGKWSYSGTISRTVVATATNSLQNTSPFSSLKLMDGEPVVKQYTCSYHGSVTIPHVRDGIVFHWDKKEEDGTLTGINDLQNADNLDPGIYQLTIQYPEGCQKVTQLFEIKDQRIKILYITPPVPQCRQPSFPVSVNYQGGTGNVVFKWVNDQGVTVATGQNANVPGGKYILHITDDAGCDVVSDPITIVPKPGPNYNMNNRQVISAPCGTNGGSITGITATVGIGTLSYTWTNSRGDVVGTNLDLTGVPGNEYYTLTLTDQSECSPYSTPQIFVGQTNSVIIGEAITTPATCGNNNGSITVPTYNITNASVFSWTGPDGIELIQYRNQLVLTNLKEGPYTLKATNPVSGCFNSRTYYVIRVQPDVFSPSVNKNDVTCGLGNNGSITLDFGTGITPNTYAWTDENGMSWGHTKDLTQLVPGKYTLTVTDRNGCSSMPLPTPTHEIEIDDIPVLAFDATNNPTPTDDHCGQQLGSISEVKIKGGIPPYSYHWTDDSGTPVGDNHAYLKNVGGGNYHLRVTDLTYCGELNPPDVSYPIADLPLLLKAPLLDNQRICSPEILTLYVKDVQNVPNMHYKLYEHYNDAVPIQTNVNGQFSLKVKETTDYYVTYNVGTCESPRTKVHVEVVLVEISMGNTITPNGDSANDVWKISGLEKFPGATVQIFTRNGQLVFSSVDYPKAFDGTFKGKPLPMGTYYYIININLPCTLISGDLTIVR